MFHGGGTRKARAAAARRLQEATVLKELAAWEKQQAIHQAAMAPWVDEPALRMGSLWANPRDLQRIAREMTEAARVIRVAARELDELGGGGR
jgi:hypothetical protein